jgi:hypothetical protein
MSFPAFDDLSSFTPAQQNQLQQFVSYILGWASAQHKDDGSHSAITCDSLTVAEPASPITAGNVTGDLIPTTTNTQSLGSSNANKPYSPLYWKQLYLGTALNMGQGSQAGILEPAWTATLSSTNQTWQANVVSGQSITFKGFTTTQPLRIGGGALVGGALHADDGCTMSVLRVSDMEGVNGLYERGRSTHLGEWIQVAYAGGNFTGNASMTWTVDAGDQSTYTYTLVGKTMTVAWFLATTTVAGTPNTTLQITIPGGFTANQTMFAAHFYKDNGATNVAGIVQVAAGTTVIGLFKIDSSNWSAATNTTQTIGQISFEVQ